MKDKTKCQINEMARLIWNEYYFGYTNGIKKEKGFDFYESIYPRFWNMALISYVECFSKHRDLLRFKI